MQLEHKALLYHKISICYNKIDDIKKFKLYSDKALEHYSELYRRTPLNKTKHLINNIKFELISRNS